LVLVARFNHWRSLSNALFEAALVLWVDIDTERETEATCQG
jgi:hypothetical protein